MKSIHSWCAMLGAMVLAGHMAGAEPGKLTVQAVVSTSGRARIKEVFVDGKPYLGVMKEAGQ